MRPAQRVQLLAHGGDLAVQLLDRPVNDGGLLAQGFDLPAAAVGLLAGLLRLLSVEGLVVDVQLHLAALGARLAALAREMILLEEERDRLLDVLHRDEAADEVGHVQQRVVHVLVGLVDVVALPVLLLAVRQGVVFPFDGFVGLRELAPLRATLVDRLERLFDVHRRDLVERAAIIHRAAVGLAVELQQRTAQGRLAAAALADEAEGLALVDIQRDAVVRPDEQALLLQREILLEVADAEQHPLPRLI